MTTARQGRKYLATVFQDNDTNLQGDKSDVRLEIKEGCPKRAYLMEVRTDPSSFESIIPDDECFISPIVDVLAPAETSTSSYILRIPHCLDEDDDRTKVKVRMVHKNREPVLVPVRAKCTDGKLFYDIDDRFIELHTAHFCQLICSICRAPYHCLKTLNNLWFARFDSHKKLIFPNNEVSRFFSRIFNRSKSTLRHVVEIRPYFGGVLYDTVDFRKVCTIQLRIEGHFGFRTS